MSLLKYVMGVAVAISLTACGGGGGNASAPVDPGTDDGSVVVVTPAIVEVLASANTLASAGSEVVITAFVKSKANVGMADQTVSFSTSSGTLQVPSAITDSSGAVTATLTAGTDKSLRDITVKVTAGSASGNVVIPVKDTRISVTGSGSLQFGNTPDTYTARAVDSSGNPISSATIEIKSLLGNLITPASALTNSQGIVSFSYTPAKAGSDTLTVSGLGTSAKTEVIVSAIDFVALSPASNTSIVVDAKQTITVRYKNSNVGVAGKTVNFSTTRGTFVSATGTTDANGDASAVLSSTTAGPATVVAQIANVGQINLPVQFVSITPSSIVVQSNPGAILPNSTGTTNQSSVEAIVRDANQNAVANKQVNFTIIKDVSNGSLSSASALTDSNGRAQVQFISGATSTAANGVEIQATVAGANASSITGITKLTVSGQALFITIAFGNTIANLDEATYSKPFSVYVTDANGVAVGNQLITLSVIPEYYYKGYMNLDSVLVGSALKKLYVVYETATCLNEDANKNGILDVSEDTNGNGLLTPGNVAVVSPGSVTTDASGRATFNILYGEQFSPWAKVEITARGTVAGTESKQSIFYKLIPAASDLDGQNDVTPAGLLSPFGQNSSCTDTN